MKERQATTDKAMAEGRANMMFMIAIHHQHKLESNEPEEKDNAYD